MVKKLLISDIAVGFENAIYRYHYIGNNGVRFRNGHLTAALMPRRKSKPILITGNAPQLSATIAESNAVDLAPFLQVSVILILGKKHL